MDDGVPVRVLHRLAHRAEETEARGHVERVARWYSQRRSVMHEPFQLRDVRTVECLVVLDDGQPRLRIGQRVRVLIGAARP